MEDLQISLPVKWIKNQIIFQDILAFSLPVLNYTAEKIVVIARNALSYRKWQAETMATLETLKMRKTHEISTLR